MLLLVEWGFANSPRSGDDGKTQQSMFLWVMVSGFGIMFSKDRLPPFLHSWLETSPPDSWFGTLPLIRYLFVKSLISESFVMYAHSQSIHTNANGICYNRIFPESIFFWRSISISGPVTSRHNQSRYQRGLVTHCKGSIGLPGKVQAGSFYCKWLPEWVKFIRKAVAVKPQTVNNTRINIIGR